MLKEKRKYQGNNANVMGKTQMLGERKPNVKGNANVKGKTQMLGKHVNVKGNMEMLMQKLRC